ncbi:hypothetical protein B0O99DRAFT_611169 [Bisporella sp. PMI_857]|nr:hypothetical protein B0O99DRAFT_611169 [Bisporella sp. PMI_857]
MRKVVLDIPAEKKAIEESIQSQAPKREPRLPAGVLHIILPALQVGAYTGAAGAFVGAFAGVVRSNTPKLFALASGLQWFTLGTTFWASRRTFMRAWEDNKITKWNKVVVSFAAGAASGLVGGALRGRKNIIPGTIMFALFGATGQVIYNMADDRNSVSKTALPAKEHSWLNSRWSPMKVLTDKEYEDMLREKLLGVNAEIALLDESIDALRAQETELAERSDKEANPTTK